MNTNRKSDRCFSFLPMAAAVLAISLFHIHSAAAAPADEAKTILSETGVRGGLVVHLGCGNGRLTAALRPNDSFLVHGLDRSAANVQSARDHIFSLGIYGPVSVDRLYSDRLPYIDNLVNLLVAEDLGRVKMDEVLRVLVPNGVAYVRTEGKWAKTVKPRPAEIDEWTHYLHAADGNPVAEDTVVGPPRHLQWVGSPNWSRHHDRTASMSALVSTGGRAFYIMDEGSRAIVQLPPKWKLIARDAFNGTVLWKRDIGSWHFHLWPLKSGPIQPARRLVASGDRVYVTLGAHAPTTVLDAATGKTVQTLNQTVGAEEILLSNGLLFLLVRPEPLNEKTFVPDRSGVWNDTRRVANDWLWNEEPRRVMAVRADSGETVWSESCKVCPMTLTAGPQRIYFHDGDRIRALDRKDGKQLWQSEPISRRRNIAKRFGPNLIFQDGVLVFSGGDRKMCALNADNGEVLWSASHPPSGHCSQEDLMIVDGLVWSGDIASGKRTGIFNGLDLKTGEVKKSFPPDVDTYWFHHRCHRSKATVNYLLPSRTGIEFVDFRNEKWIANHWVRGGCIYGIMPCNGLIYAPPHSCACYMESKQYGFNALAPESDDRRVPRTVPSESRLEKGPLYDTPKTETTREADGAVSWPMHRHDPGRSSATAAQVPAELKPLWTKKLGGRLSSVVVAYGLAFVAAVDAHTLYAMDADSGKIVWHYTVGGRIDSPPAIYRGRALFGAADGWVYCLRASDGALVWRFRAAPVDRCAGAFEQIESVWPVSGSVLIQHDPEAKRDVLYCVAGRSMFLDGGLRLIRLDPVSGELLSESILDDRDPKTGENLQKYVQVLNMPTALPDILSSDGKYVYMRSQRFLLSGQRVEADLTVDDPTTRVTLQEGEDRHIFCPNGFLDGDWLHRTYWLYGRRYSAGCNWWANAGRYTPAGRLLVYDDESVYGYGRRPEYFQWSVPLGYHLFGCKKGPQLGGGPSAGPSEIAVGKSESLNPAGKPLTVEAWVLSSKPDGVILVRGGSSHGYGLILNAGKPSFAIRVDNKLHSAASDAEIPVEWTHVAGVLTQDKKLKLYVNGQLKGESEASGFITADPNETMQIGWDQGSALGDYREAPRFIGRIDEVRIYHRALDAEEVKRHATEKPDALSKKALVLHFSFDAEDARDESGNKNDGGVGTDSVAGRFGKGMYFDGSKVRKTTRGALRIGKAFQHRWSHDCPIHVRAMALAGDRLFVAGLPNVLDEEEAYRRPHDDDVHALLAKQDDAFQGRLGGLLLVVSPKDGTELARYKLESPPTWDSMAAVPGRLCFATLDGRVVCMGAK